MYNREITIICDNCNETRTEMNISATQLRRRLKDKGGVVERGKGTLRDYCPKCANIEA